MRQAKRISICLTRYREGNFILWQTLDSLATQRGIEADVLLLDQSDDPGTRARLSALSSPHIRFDYRVISGHSLSHARNQAIELSDNEILLFIDCDAIAEADWAAELASTLRESDAGLVGGRILPKWLGRPLLIARSSLVRDLYSLLDLGAGEHPATKIVGASFGMSLSRLGAEAYFDEQLGRRPGVLLGGEESDLVRRARRRGVEVWYNGRAVANHQVSSERLRYDWVMRRIYWQGYTRAMTGGKVGGSNPPNVGDYFVLPLLLPIYLTGFLRGRFRRR